MAIFIKSLHKKKIINFPLKIKGNEAITAKKSGIAVGKAFSVYSFYIPSVHFIERIPSIFIRNKILIEVFNIYLVWRIIIILYNNDIL